MKTIKSKTGVEIKIYSSASDMPCGRYSDFNKYLALEVGIDYLEETLNRSIAFMQSGDIESAEVENKNAISALLSLKNGVGIYTYPFAILVAEIEGNEVTDTSFEGLTATIEQIKSLGITQKEIETSVEDVKKK